MRNYFPPYNNSSKNIKVELDLSNYATKDDVKNITHVDVSSYASKTNLAALKTEVDKIDTDKLKTVPDDLAELSNVVKNDVVKKTDFSADDYVKKTKFSTDNNALDDKIDKVDKKIPSVAILVKDLDDRIDTIKIKDYVKKTSLSGYMLTSTFNTKSAELQNKINANDKKITSVKSNLSGYAKKSEVANDITTIKNDYVSNASLTSKLNDLKAQHIATEVKTIDDKTKKNASDILAFETRLKQKEDIVDESQRGNSFTRGFFYHLHQSYLVYECKIDSFNAKGSEISAWKLTDISNHPDNSSINVVLNSKGNHPILIKSRLMSVNLYGNYFTQNQPLKRNSSAINIYIVYELSPISSTRDTDYTIQNASFGAMKITKNTDSSKNNYTGYGLYFDEGGEFRHTVRQGNFDCTASAKNVIIFGVDMSCSIHATNRANSIYVMGKNFIQGINDTTIYAEKLFHNNFTELGLKFVLRLHYNGDNSYLFANGREELKFKAKDDQLIDEKLCLGNLSSEWTTSESEKTGVYGAIYDFIVDYKTIYGVRPIYDMHRYLMTKHSIIL